MCRKEIPEQRIIGSPFSDGQRKKSSDHHVEEKSPPDIKMRERGREREDENGTCVFSSLIPSCTDCMHERTSRVGINGLSCAVVLSEALIFHDERAIKKGANHIFLIPHLRARSMHNEENILWSVRGKKRKPQTHSRTHSRDMQLYLVREQEVQP